MHISIYKKTGNTRCKINLNLFLKLFSKTISPVLIIKDNSKYKRIFMNKIKLSPMKSKNCDKYILSKGSSTPDFL